MNQPPQAEKQASKRIVSKGAYAKAQGERAYMGGVGIFLLLIAAFCLLLLYYGLTDFFAIESTDAANHRKAGDLTMQECLLVGSLVGAVMFGKWGILAIKQVRIIDPGVPLTRANTADLPAPDTLVRASQEPLQAQETVLLRAATATTDVQEAQLLRASGEPE